MQPADLRTIYELFRQHMSQHGPEPPETKLEELFALFSPKTAKER